MTYFLCGFVMCTIYLIQDFVEPIETKVFSVAYWNLLGGGEMLLINSLLHL